MSKQKYDLLPDECIILKATSVRHGFWAAYTDELVLTNQCVILVRMGMLGNFKGIVRYPLSDIKLNNGKPQAIIGEAQNGEKQLEIYFTGGMEEFAFQSGNDRDLRVWTMAIADQFLEEKEMYDFNYYQNFSDNNVQLITYDNSDCESGGSGINGKFLGDVTKSVFKSGDFSVGGVVNGVKKASLKQTKSGLTQGITTGLKDELGITDIQDEFTNVFREAFGLKPKITQADLKEQQEKQKEQQLKAAFNQKVANARQEVQLKRGVEFGKTGERSTNNTSSKMSMDEQIETIKKLKELMDAGILTKEEFEIKKKEILNF